MAEAKRCASTSMSRASTAGVIADAGTSAASTISETPSRSSSAAISRSHWVSGGGHPQARELTLEARAKRKDLGAPRRKRCHLECVAESSASASGFPADTWRIDPAPKRRVQAPSLDTIPARPDRSTGAASARRYQPPRTAMPRHRAAQPTSREDRNPGDARRRPARPRMGGRATGHRRRRQDRRAGSRSARSVSVASAIRNGSSAAPSTEAERDASAADCGFGNVSSPPGPVEAAGGGQRTAGSPRSGRRSSGGPASPRVGHPNGSFQQC